MSLDNKITSLALYFLKEGLLDEALDLSLLKRAGMLKIPPKCESAAMYAMRTMWSRRLTDNFDKVKIRLEEVQKKVDRARKILETDKNGISERIRDAIEIKKDEPRDESWDTFETLKGSISYYDLKDGTVTILYDHLSFRALGPHEKREQGLDTSVNYFFFTDKDVTFDSKLEDLFLDGAHSRYGHMFDTDVFMRPIPEDELKELLEEFIEEGESSLAYSDGAIKDTLKEIEEAEKWVENFDSETNQFDNGNVQIVSEIWAKIYIDLAEWPPIEGKVRKGMAVGRLPSGTFWINLSRDESNDRIAHWSHMRQGQDGFVKFFNVKTDIRTYSLENIYTGMVETLMHELRHFAQDLINFIFVIPSQQQLDRGRREMQQEDDRIPDIKRDPWDTGGLPPKSVRKPGWGTWHTDPNWTPDPTVSEPQSAPVGPHQLRDIEYYPRLGDAITSFLNTIPKIEQKDIRKYVLYFTGMDENAKPTMSRDGKSYKAWENWNRYHWFWYLKEQDPDRWRGAVKLFVQKVMESEALQSLPERQDKWPVAPVRHPAWGKSVMSYFDIAIRENPFQLEKPRHEYEDWRIPYEMEKEHKQKMWPSIRQSYKDFVDSLSPAQLVRHKFLVNEQGDLEYWVAPRLQTWDGKSGLPNSSRVDHPNIPEKYRY